MIRRVLLVLFLFVSPFCVYADTYKGNERKLPKIFDDRHPDSSPTSKNKDIKRKEEKKEPLSSSFDIDSEEMARGEVKPSFYDELKIEKEWKNRREKRMSRREQAFLERSPKPKARGSRN